VARQGCDLSVSGATEITPVLPGSPARVQKTRIEASCVTGIAGITSVAVATGLPRVAAIGCNSNCCLLCVRNAASRTDFSTNHVTFSALCTARRGP
jgi:hypothetical protein